MLEVKNLIKIYKTKGGVTVKALDDVSLQFPEKGMIFLLGKSGSGKSTLLNVIGGLDKPDSGEIIIKGKNSKTFSGADFDSYRNTYIGFIFQEYNILDEFNIEQNISLALQLQGKPNDKKAVEAILEQVDLVGFGKRKPNTLSGGQKQRVAIARALIKDPEIIMADEPTGALDSNTGKQVFDTLKKLSQDKLVIIVSHDRDFAEHYADRIIELSDGKIISDVSKEYVSPVTVNTNINIVNNNTVTIKDTSKLTSHDMEEILNVLKGHEGQAIISANEQTLPSIRQTLHMSEDGSSEVFEDTKEVKVNEYDGSKTKFIRSHLPFARAFKMGASSLKTKPVRLIFTMLLNIVALVMFGLTSTLMLFDESYSISRALNNAIYASEAVTKEYKYTTHNYRVTLADGTREETYSYSSYNSAYFSQDEITDYNKQGLNYIGMYNFSLPSQWSSRGVNITNYGNSGMSDYYSTYSYISGFIDSWADFDNQLFSITVGNYPTNVNEITLPKYIAEGYKDSYGLSNLSDLLTKEIALRVQTNVGQSTIKAIITGVFEGSPIPEKFNKLKLTDGSLSQKERSELEEEFGDYLKNSLHTCALVHPDFFDTYKDGLMEKEQRSTGSSASTVVHGVAISNYYREDTVDRDETSQYLFDNDLKLMKNAVNFYDLDGNPIEYSSLENELDVYLPYYYYQNKYNDEVRNLTNTLYDMFKNRNRTETLYNLTTDQVDEYTSRLDELRNNYWSGFSKKDIEYLNEIIRTYYVEYARYTYDLNMMKAMYDGGYSERAYISDTEFNQFDNNYKGVENSDPYDYSSIESIRDYLSRDPNHYLKHFYLMRYAKDSTYHYDRQDIIALIDKFNNEKSLEDREWDVIEEFVSSVGYSSSNWIYQNDYQVNDHIAPHYSEKWYYSSYKGSKGVLNVKGFYQAGNDSSTVIKDSFAKTYGWLEEYTNKTITESDYKSVDNPKYGYIITATNYSQNQVGEMLKDYGSFRLRMTNGTYRNMGLVLEMVTTMKTVFLIIGIVFAVFAALMLFNFISTSIASKTKEIGILRAVGARGSDLFKIFFSESGLVSIICVAIAVGISIYVSIILNDSIIEKVGIALINFGVINIGIIAAGALVIAFLGTFLPVLLASRKPPVESIRTL